MARVIGQHSIRICWLLALLLSGTIANADESDANLRKQVRVRAAFIFQMSKFVNWSLPASAPLVFCLFPEDSDYNVGLVLNGLAQQGKLVSQQHPVTIHLIDVTNAQQKDQYRDCALIYFNDHNSEKVPSPIIKTLGITKLVIGDDKQFVENGGLAALVYERGKHKLYINRSSYESSMVKIRSRLLSLARFYPQ